MGSTKGSILREQNDRLDQECGTAIGVEIDPDNRPLTPEDLARMRRTPQVKIIRRALRLSQEVFSERFHIPIGTLRDWEQGRKEPDAAARAYLRVIGRNPDAVIEALRENKGDYEV